MKVSSILSHLAKRYRAQYDEPHTIYKKEGDSAFFRQSVYSKWAIKEIFRYLDENRHLEIIESLENFRYMADNYACKKEDPQISFMFSVAKDVATDILDYVIMEVGREQRRIY